MDTTLPKWRRVALYIIGVCVLMLLSPLSFLVGFCRGLHAYTHCVWGVYRGIQYNVSAWWRPELIAELTQGELDEQHRLRSDIKDQADALSQTLSTISDSGLRGFYKSAATRQLKRVVLNADAAMRL